MMAEIVVVSTEEPTREQVLTLLDQLREAMKIEISGDVQSIPWNEWVHKDATVPLDASKDENWVRPYGDQWHYGYLQLIEKENDNGVSE